MDKRIKKEFEEYKRYLITANQFLNKELKKVLKEKEEIIRKAKLFMG